MPVVAKAERAGQEVPEAQVGRVEKAARVAPERVVLVLLEMAVLGVPEVMAGRADKAARVVPEAPVVAVIILR